MRLAGDHRILPPMPADVPEPDRAALLAIQRASMEGDPVQRVAAFWDAVEFYVGKRGSRKLFDDDEISTIVDRATSDLPDEKANRVRRLLEDLLNNQSLMTRLQQVLAEDQVPLTNADRALLRKLRRQRNRVAHGGRAMPAHADLDRAVAMISRAMVIRGGDGYNGYPLPGISGPTRGFGHVRRGTGSADATPRIDTRQRPAHGRSRAIAVTSAVLRRPSHRRGHS